MPFVSDAQRRWMYATNPEMAARWQEHTPKKKKKKKKLPETVKMTAKIAAVALESVGVDAAIERLAMRKVALDNGFEQPLSAEIVAASGFLAGVANGVKQANSITDTLSGLAVKAKQSLPDMSGVKQVFNRVGETYKGLDPAAQRMLLGAGVGTAAGLGASALSKKKNKSWLNNALLGGLAGTAVGGGLHMLADPRAGKRLTDAVAGKPIEPITPPRSNPDDPNSPPISEDEFVNLTNEANSRTPEMILAAGGTAAGLGGIRYGMGKSLDTVKATGAIEAALADPKKQEVAKAFMNSVTPKGAPHYLSKRSPGIDKLLNTAVKSHPEKTLTRLSGMLGTAEKDLPKISRFGRVGRLLGKANPRMLAGLLAGAALTGAGAYTAAQHNRSAAAAKQQDILKQLADAQARRGK